MTRIRLLGFAVTAALASTLPWTPAAAQDTIDRPINLYVAGTAGGGIDLYARVLARHIGRHIPGKPAVNVQVMPGAGGIRAANFPGAAGAEGRHRDHHLRRRPDPRAADRVAQDRLRQQSVHLDWRRHKDVGMCVAWGASPFKTIKDAQREP
jgi:tripartite-type tricarboxylate transporter receptor subunit TctC